MDSHFESLGLLPQFVQTVEQLGFEKPTPIQLAAIPALLDGRNVIGQAQTGTGKTAAFALPMLQLIQPGEGSIQALILTPTRELAIQVAEAAGRMAEHTPIRVLPVYGGQSYQIQTRQLKRGVDVVVGTPGRLLDLIRQGLLDLSHVRYLVLDEADEMLEMGFIEDVESILSQVSGERQIALFSATMPQAVRKLADRYLNNPQKITINPTQMTVAETEQRFCRVHEEKKLAALAAMLEMEDVKSALIFARTKARTQELADKLIQLGYPADSLHGDLNQSRREYVLNRFRQQTITIVVATDVAARGLDVDDISHVFNYDVPNDAEDYVHRIGRTGRAGRKGIAITFLTPRERGRLKQIEAYTRQPIMECQAPTREAIQARRDEQFSQRMTEHMDKGKIANARLLVAKMVEAGINLEDIAAAAVHLARLGETIIPTNPTPAYVKEPREERSSRREGLRMIRHMEDNKGPAKANREWQHPSSKDASIRRNKRHNRGQEAGMVRLIMNLGESHGLRPSDVVGAIASEVGIPGRAIGEILIQQNYTFVDVAEKHVRQVLQGSGGQYQVRGKPVMLKLAK